jgi:hypothetical protein
MIYVLEFCSTHLIGEQLKVIAHVTPNYCTVNPSLKDKYSWSVKLRTHLHIEPSKCHRVVLKQFTISISYNTADQHYPTGSSWPLQCGMKVRVRQLSNPPTFLYILHACMSGLLCNPFL